MINLLNNTIFIAESIFIALIILGIILLLDKLFPKSAAARPKKWLYRISFTGWDDFHDGGSFFKVFLKLIALMAIYKISFWLGVSVTIVLIILSKKKLAITDNKTESANNPDGFKLSYWDGNKTKQLNISNPYRGNLIIGGAGSGKSISLIYPIIQQAAEKEFTGILYDFKSPELTQVLYNAYKGKGVKLFNINFNDVRYSHRINPLNPDGMLNSSYARELAVTLLANLNPESIKKKDFWIQSSEAILTSVIWFLKCEYPQYCTMPHVISLILYSKPTDLIKTLEKNSEVAGLISSVTAGLKSDNQTAGVFASVKSSLALMNRPELFWILSGNDFDLTLNQPDKKSFLCIANDPTLTESISPLVSLLIISCLKRMNTPNKAPSVVILDEAPTLYIPNFDQIPATARSNKIATVFCAQDIAQMEDKYGMTKAETILSNLGNQFYGRTTNPKTAERVIKLFGKHEVEFTSNSKSRANTSLFAYNKSESKSFQQRERVQMQDILNLKAGHFYSIIAGNEQELNAKPLPFMETNADAEILSPLAVDQQAIMQNYELIKKQALAIIDTTEEEKKEQTAMQGNPFL